MKKNYKKIIDIIGLLFVLVIFVIAGKALLYNSTIKNNSKPIVKAADGQGLEESLSWNGWNQETTTYSDNGIVTSTNYPNGPALDTIKEFSDKIEGNFSFKLTGQKESIVNLQTKQIPLRPGQKYRLSFWTKVSNRQCYTVSVLKNGHNPAQYPPSFLLKDNENDPDKMSCGTYNVFINEKNSSDQDIYPISSTGLPYDPMQDIFHWGEIIKYSVLQNQINDAPYIRNRNIPWSLEEVEFTSSSQASKLVFAVNLLGYIGDYLIDDIKLEEIDSFVDDADLRMPVRFDNSSTSDLPIMKLNSISPSEAQTNAVSFTFGSDTILAKHNQDQDTVLSNIQFAANELADLTASDQKNDGYGLLENNNVIISIGADSTAIIKFKKDTTFNITGINPAYSFFKNGLIYVRDVNKNSSDPDSLLYGNGFTFQPILGSGDYRHIYTKTTNPPVLPSVITDDWNFSPKTTENDKLNNNWEISYSAKTGDAFLLSVFPPKDFDMKNFCNNRTQAVFRDMYGQDAGSNQYAINQLSDIYNSVIIWQGSYNKTANFQFEGYNENILPDNVKTIVGDNQIYDVAGPFLAPADDTNLKENIRRLHEAGLKVLFYMSPSYFYTSKIGDPNQIITDPTQIDSLLSNLKYNLDKYNIDGVYFDGNYVANPIKNLELGRKVRIALGNKLYVQHESGNGWFYGNWRNFYGYLGSPFRLPVFDAYADLVWVGESEQVDSEDAFLNKYTGKNMSNSASVLLMEDRFPLNFDSSLGQFTFDPGDATDANSQVRKQLNNLGQIIASFSGYNPYLIQAKGETWVYDQATRDLYQNQTWGYFRLKSDTWQSIDYLNYRQQLDAVCKPFTDNDNMCDVGENIFDNSKDCLTPDKDSLLKKEENRYLASSDKSLANWIIDGNPLFKLHLRADSGALRDISGNKLDPGGDLDANQTPAAVTIDGEKAVHFNGSSNFLYAYYGNDEKKILDLNDKSFSIFVRLKKESTDNNYHPIFEYDRSGRLYFTIFNNKLRVSFRDQDNIQIVYDSNTVLDNNWHDVGFVYDKDNDTLTFYLDGMAEPTIHHLPGQLQEFMADSFYLGAAFNTYFQGYLSDFFVADRTLSDEQIRAFHDSALKTFVINSPEINNVKAVFIDAQGRLQYFQAANPSISADKQFAAPGGIITYDITYTNTTTEPINNLVIAAPLDPKTEYVAGSASRGGALEQNEIIWHDESAALPPGWSIAVNFKVKVK